MSPHDLPRTGESVSHTPSVPPGWRKALLVLKVVEVRLRFVAILIVIGLFLGYWDTISNYWERETRSDGRVYHAVRTVFGQRIVRRVWPQADAPTVAADTEFYCPMHPLVIRSTRDPDGSDPKCPICGMSLSLRKKGEIPRLPIGVLSRKQFSPEQIHLAGITTTEVAYRPLEREITTVGYVTYDESRRSQITVRASGYLEKLFVDEPWTALEAGAPLAEIYSPELYSAAKELLVATQRRVARTGSGSADRTRDDLDDSVREKLRLLGVGPAEIDEIVKSQAARPRIVLRAPFSGHLVRKNVVAGAHVEAGQTLFEIADLTRVWIEAEIYESDLEFVRKGQTIEATLEAFPGRIFAAKVSLVHPHLEAATRTNAVRFAVDNPRHELRPGMFATVRIKTPLSEVPAFREVAKNGQVLAVPERAVIDTGDRKVVYLERGAGSFEGVEAELGPVVDEFYPVLKGLIAGERVADRAAFLVDAESRLNPAAASTYVGAGGGPQKSAPDSPSAQPGESEPSHGDEQRPAMTRTKSPSPEDRRNIAKLGTADRELALAQAICPVSGEPLGSMGMPIRVVLNEHAVFLCCKGCEPAALQHPEKVLKKLAQAKSHQEPTPTSQGTTADEKKSAFKVPATPTAKP